VSRPRVSEFEYFGMKFVGNIGVNHISLVNSQAGEVYVNDTPCLMYVECPIQTCNSVLLVRV